MYSHPHYYKPYARWTSQDTPRANPTFPSDTSVHHAYTSSPHRWRATRPSTAPSSRVVYVVNLNGTKRNRRSTLLIYSSSLDNPEDSFSFVIDNIQPLKGSPRGPFRLTPSAPLKGLSFYFTDPFSPFHCTDKLDAGDSDDSDDRHFRCLKQLLADSSSGF